ncbi:MAG: hypothetical protein Q9226_006723, partial [Calogaya cf. arnoldii]
QSDQAVKKTGPAKKTTGPTLEQIMGMGASPASKQKGSPLDQLLQGLLPLDQASQPTPPGHQQPAPPADQVEENRRTSWKIIWEAGVARHERELERRPAPDKEYHQIRSTSNLDNEDVHQGIASVWDAVVQQLDRPFAYNQGWQYNRVRGDMDAGNDRREQIPAAVYGAVYGAVCGVVDGPPDLLIPMQIDSEFVSPPNSAGFAPGEGPTEGPKEPPVASDKGKDKKAPPPVGKGGHIASAIARRIEEKSDGDRLGAIIFDSHPTPKNHKRIPKIIQNTARRIGWLGMDKDGNQVEDRLNPPNLAEEDIQQIRVPSQVSEDSCGIHSILHAWGHMIGLPPVNSYERLHGKSFNTWQLKMAEEIEFIDNALRMINLALAGLIDLRTIQAFFNYYGFCALQDPENREEAKSVNVRATMMSETILFELCQNQREVEQVYGATRPVPRFPEADIKRLRQRFDPMTYREAYNLLDAAVGDVEMAIVMYEQ